MNVRMPHNKGNAKKEPGMAAAASQRTIYASSLMLSGDSTWSKTSFVRWVIPVSRTASAVFDIVVYEQSRIDLQQIKPAAVRQRLRYG